MNHHEQENWQQADARVLGQILAAQNIIFALPDTTRIAEFYVQTLISIPGIAACRVCLGGRSALAGEMDTSVCEQCEVLHLAVGEGSSFAPVDSNFMCSLIGQPDIRCIAINSYQHHFGFFVIKIKDAAVLDVYYPFIVNLSNYLAITLENRWQKDLLQRSHAELECKVEERTYDLTVANVELQREITHRQRAEEALSQQYSTLRSIIDSANAHIFSLDREYRYTSFNQSHAAVMKTIYGAEIETGQNLLGYMIVAEDREAAKRNLDRALAGEQIVEEAYSGEELLSRRYFQVSHSPIKTERDEVIGVAVLAQDITERKQAEEEQLVHLRFFEHLDQVNRVIQGTNDLEQMMGDVLDVVLSVFDSDRAFLIYPCDPEADSWMVPVERTKSEYLGVSMSGLEMPVDAEVVAMLRILRDSDRPVKFGPDSRYPLPAKVAKRFGFQSFLATALYPKAGKPWLFGIHQCSHLRTESQEEERLLQEIGQRLADALTSLLTYRRVQESERDLQQSNDLLRAIIEAAPTAIAGLDLDGNVQLVWNPAAEKMLGWTAQEAMGHLLPSVPVDSHEEFRRFRDHIRSGKSLSGVDVRRQRRDGSPIDYSIYASPLYDAEGRIIGNIAILVDITERKRAEETLRRLNRELQAISSCNQALLRAVDEQTLLNEICHIICDQAGYRLAWVGYVENDEAKTVRPVAWAGFDSEYVANAQLSWAANTERGRGPAGTAIRSGEIVYIQDFATDPRMAPWREDALRRGYCSSIALPLKDENSRVFGVLLLYSAEADVITPDEIRLMEELAGDLAFGITALHLIRKRKQAEDALRESEEKYRSLIQKVQTAIVLHDGHGQILASNPLAQHLLGLSEEQLSGKTLDEPTWHFLREDGSKMPIIEYPISLVLSSQQPLRGYMVGIKHPDKLIWVLINAEPEFADTGEIIQVIVSFIDITEKKQAEELLRKLSRAVEQSPVSIVITDTTGAIEYVNPQFTELTGYAFEEVLGQNPRLLKSGKTSPDKYQELWETILSGRVWQGEFCNKKKTGELYWEWVSIAPVTDRTGTITNFVAAKENITERKRVEQELEQYREHLEELVAKRTIELQTANEQLQVLSRAKDAFVSNVSHELRTPITSLKMREYLLKAHPERLAEHIQVIERETDRLAQIIENLLQLSRLDQERMTFSLEPVDLNTLLGQYVLDRKLIAEDKRLSLVFHGEPDLPEAMADANLLGQALSVLLTNALNYTPAEGQVTVQTHTDSFADRQWVGFSVIDTGLGISPDEQSKLFTRFFRGNTGHRSGVPGTGLGLAIAKEIVDRHNGRIEVKSDGIPGKGTTFTVWIPTLDPIASDSI